MKCICLAQTGILNYAQSWLRISVLVRQKQTFKLALAFGHSQGLKTSEIVTDATYTTCAVPATLTPGGIPSQVQGTGFDL